MFALGILWGFYSLFAGFCFTYWNSDKGSTFFGSCLGGLFLATFFSIAAIPYFILAKKENITDFFEETQRDLINLYFPMYTYDYKKAAGIK